MIIIGADHRGFKLKQNLLKYLTEVSISFQDIGAFDYSVEDDYVDFAISVCNEVSKNPQNFGILLCGSGVGMDIVANKTPGIRSALVTDHLRAIQSRSHEDINVICLPADIVSETEAAKIVSAFINTEFSGDERHLRRLSKLLHYERSFLK